MKQGFLLILIMFGLFLVPAVDARIQCALDSDCEESEFCEFQNCWDETGICVRKPDPNQCEVLGFVCGCGGETYLGDCHRKAAGVSRNYMGECIDQISVNYCRRQSHCPGHLECIEFPDIGNRCAEPDPCSYFNCSKQSPNSICVNMSSSVFPSEIICVGDCASDDDCGENEFCDMISDPSGDASPCDFGAGICTIIPEICPSTLSPVCGCNGKIYGSDCLRKRERISKNHNGECIDEISNVTCNADDMFRDTCGFIGTCIRFPGIGRRCAVNENISDYYPCPEGFEFSVNFMYPRGVNCHKNCLSDGDCDSTDYAEYICELSKWCPPNYTPEQCKPMPCDPNNVSGVCFERHTPPREYPSPVCGCDNITYRNIEYLVETGTVFNYYGECENGVNITNISCDALNPCPEGLELDCFSFPDIGLRCAQQNPCSYYQCPEGTECLVAEMYPASVHCSPLQMPPGGEETVEYNVITGEIRIVKHEHLETHNISLYQVVGESRGILKTETVSAKYSGELAIEESSLFMKTSAGNKEIKILPEEASSKATKITQVSEIELKEESQKPIYSVKGTKKARILFIFPVKLKIETKVDAETGDVVSIKKPWWSFLAW